MQECGECTLCCVLLEIRDKQSPPLEVCPDCNLNVGCIRYDSRPEDCVNFNCSWKFDDNAHEDMRPDKCHVIFENLSEHIVFATIDPNYIISDLVMKQIAAFQRSGNSVFLQTFKNKPQIFLTEGANGNDVWNFIQEKLREYKNDSTKLLH